MITGRVTYGFGRLGQVDQTSVLQAFPNPLTDSSVVQTPIAQWGIGEYAVVGGALYMLYSVLTTTKRGVGRVRGAVQRRRERLAKQHQAAAEHYRAHR